MRLFKRVGATVLVVLVAFSIAASCFASPVAITGIDFFTAAFQTFIEICGLTSVVSSNGVNSSSSDPYSQLQLTDQYQSLYDEYQATLSNQQSISDWYTTYKDSIYIGVDSETSVISPTIDAQLAEWFSGFAGWILEDKYNCTRTESGFEHSGGTFSSPLVSSSSISMLPAFPSSPSKQVLMSDGMFLAHSSSFGWDAYGACSDGSIMPFRIDRQLVVLTTNPDSRFYYVRSIDSAITDVSASGWGTYDNVFYWQYVNYLSGNSPLPDYASVDAAVNAYLGASVESISLRPKDKYNEDAIPVPNVESSTYIPQSIEGEYTDAITGALEGVVSPTLDDVLQAVLDAITENTEVIAEEKVDPAPVNPVMPPFMPFDLPSFDFNLSGIWYYVTRWVNSIGSGVSLLFNVFANIPAAMFYPVFGSAVVVIVIGVWKRFIA